MMEQLMDNEGKSKAHDGQNGEWQKTNGPWWKYSWKMVRKLMEHDGTTNVTWKKTNGKSRKRTRTWKKTNRKLKTAKNKNNNKSWKKNITLFDFSIQSVSKQCS